MAKLGYIGLGIMGGRMARRLLDGGHSVTGYNHTRSRAQWLLGAGIVWSETPRAVTETADITFSMATNTSALNNVMDGPDGLMAGLKPGSIHVDKPGHVQRGCL